MQMQPPQHNTRLLITNDRLINSYFDNFMIKVR